jgi:hypothetical protein
MMYAHSPPVFDLSFSAAPTPPSPLPPLPLPLLHEGEADDAIYNHLVSCSIFLGNALWLIGAYAPIM